VTDPLWAILRDEGRYNLIWLAARTGYSHSHVKAVAAGREAASPRFRAAVAALLKRPEGELFDQGDASATPQRGANHREGTAGVAAGYADGPILSMPEEAPRSHTA